MWHAFAQLLPIAIVAALSVVPIMATIVILVSDKRTQSALPYATGWVVGTAVLVTLTTVAAAFLPEGRARHRDQAIGSVEIVIGVALIVLGVVSLVRQRSASARPVPSWMNRVDSLDSLPAFGLGLALNARPKAFLLAVAAGLVLHTASLAARGRRPRQSPSSRSWPPRPSWRRCCSRCCPPHGCSRASMPRTPAWARSVPRSRPWR